MFVLFFLTLLSLGLCSITLVSPSTPFFSPFSIEPLVPLWFNQVSTPYDTLYCVGVDPNQNAYVFLFQAQQSTLTSLLNSISQVRQAIISVDGDQIQITMQICGTVRSGTNLAPTDSEGKLQLIIIFNVALVIGIAVLFLLVYMTMI